MADELDEEEAELLRKHRAKKAAARKGRKVTVRGKHDTGDYEFELDGDEADRIIARHRALWEGDDDEGGEASGDEGGEASGEASGDEGGEAPGRASGGGRRAPGKPAAAAAQPSTRAPYFKR